MATSTSEKLQIKFATLVSVFALFLAITGGTYAVAQGPLPDLTDVSAAPVGTVAPFAGSTEPPGWLFADGSAVSRTAYSELFAVIGTTYGSGDGSTTFNIPDLRGRVAVDKGTQANVDTLGDSEGLAVSSRQPNHSHTVNSHTHTAPAHYHGPGSLALAYASSIVFSNTTDAGGYGASFDQIRSAAPNGAGTGRPNPITAGFSGSVGATGGSNGDSTMTSGSASPGTDMQGPAFLTLNYIIHAKPAP